MQTKKNQKPKANTTKARTKQNKSKEQNKD